MKLIIMLLAGISIGMSATVFYTSDKIATLEDKLSKQKVNYKYIYVDQYGNMYDYIKEK